MRHKNIESALQEARRFAPPPAFAARARLRAPELEAMRRGAAADHVGFWGELARKALHWHKPFTVTLDDSTAPNYRWFPDGELNVSWNCLDVHLAAHGDKTAIIAEGEAGDRMHQVFPAQSLDGGHSFPRPAKSARPATRSVSSPSWRSCDSIDW